MSVVKTKPQYLFLLLILLPIWADYYLNVIRTLSIIFPDLKKINQSTLDISWIIQLELIKSGNFFPSETDSCEKNAGAAHNYYIIGVPLVFLAYVFQTTVLKYLKGLDRYGI